MYSLTNKDIDRVALSIAMIRQPSARRPESGYKCQDQGLVLQVFFRKNEICNKGKDNKAKGRYKCLITVNGTPVCGQ